MIAAIVAVDENWGIGFNGELLERIPEDLKYFKELTTGNTVVMGRKTWDSLPVKPLPNRGNFIISRETPLLMENKAIRMTLDMIKDTIEANRENENYFIIGGGQIYKELLSLCDRVYVTKIFKSHDNVDTYFPNLDEPEMWKTWQPVQMSRTNVYNNIMYQFWTYDRIN